MPTRREPPPDRATQLQRAVRKVKRGTRALRCVSFSTFYMLQISYFKRMFLSGQVASKQAVNYLVSHYEFCGGLLLMVDTAGSER